MNNIPNFFNLSEADKLMLTAQDEEAFSNNPSKREWFLTLPEPGKLVVRIIYYLQKRKIILGWTDAARTEYTHVYCHPQTDEWYFQFAPLSNHIGNDALDNGYILNFGSGVYFIELLPHLHYVYRVLRDPALKREAQMTIDGKSMHQWYAIHFEMYQELQDYVPPAPTALFTPKPFALPEPKSALPDSKSVIYL